MRGDQLLTEVGGVGGQGEGQCVTIEVGGEEIGGEDGSLRLLCSLQEER